MNRKLLSAIVILAIVLAAGCVQEPASNDQINKSFNDSSTQESVPVAPYGFNLHAGQTKNFIYFGSKNISVKYQKENHVNKVTVKMNGREKKIYEDINSSKVGVYWEWGNYSLSVEPLTWEVRDGQRIPFYGETWNTSNISFEVRYTGTQSSGEGGIMK